MKLGVLVHLGTDVDATFKQVADLGLDNCQLACWSETKMTDENAKAIKAATKSERGVTKRTTNAISHLIASIMSSVPRIVRTPVNSCAKPKRSPSVN